VADLGALLGSERSFADVSFAGEPTAAVVSAVAFAPLLSSATQEGVERAAEDAIAPDVAVDRLVTDRELAVKEQAARDLLWTQSPAQQRFDTLQIVAREALITS